MSELLLVAPLANPISRVDLCGPDMAELLTKAIYSKLATTMKSPVFFAFSFSSGDAEREAGKLEALRSALLKLEKDGVAIPAVELHFPVDELVSWSRSAEQTHVRCFALDCKSVEKVRDAVKQVFWQCWGTSDAVLDFSISESKYRLPELIAVLSKPHDRREAGAPMRRLVSLAKHGLFYPGPRRTKSDIQVVTFDHGGGHFYRYRFAETKLQQLAKELSNLRDYLNGLVADCPNHFFRSGPRISAVEWPVGVRQDAVSRHVMCDYVAGGLASSRFKGAHDNVEVFCIENDPFCVGIEIPVWIEPGELGAFSGLFNRGEPITGHIDLLRVVDGTIEIWDFKPNAAHEKSAGLQVLLYAVALSIRLDLPLTKFRCGYFDSQQAYVCDPPTCLD